MEKRNLTGPDWADRLDRTDEIIDLIEGVFAEAGPGSPLVQRDSVRRTLMLAIRGSWAEADLDAACSEYVAAGWPRVERELSSNQVVVFTFHY